MRQDFEIIISDTSCLILLVKIEGLELLRAIGQRIVVTPEIQHEFGAGLPDWIEVISPSDRHYLRILEMELDEGEASAIALCLELENAILILDDLRGRRMAKRLSLRFSGTFGLLLKAKQLGAIDSVKPFIDRIRQTDFRFTEELLSQTMKAAGET